MFSRFFAINYYYYYSTNSAHARFAIRRLNIHRNITWHRVCVHFIISDSNIISTALQDAISITIIYYSINYNIIIVFAIVACRRYLSIVLGRPIVAVGSARNPRTPAATSAWIIYVHVYRLVWYFFFFKSTKLTLHFRFFAKSPRLYLAVSANSILITLFIKIKKKKKRYM